MKVLFHLSLALPKDARRLFSGIVLAFLWVSAFTALALPVQAAPPQPISPDGQDARYPAIAVTASGVVHVVWEQDNGLWSTRLEQGSWTTPVQVAAQGESPTLAASRVDEEVYLAWAQEFGGDYEIFARRWNGSQWSTPQNVSDNDGGSSSPAFAVAPNGQIHLVWADTSPGVETVYHAISTDGIAWPTASPIPNALGGSPTAVFAPDGTLHVAWQHRANFAEKLRVWVASYAGSWQAPTVLTDGAQHALAPTLAAGPGRTLLTWEEGAQAKLANLNQGVWQALAVETGGAPALGVTANDVAYWAWETDAGFFRRFGRGGWSDPWSWATNVQSRGDLALAVSQDQVHMVWAERQKGGVWRILYNSESLSMLYQPILLR
ncbi:MAG: exo-alpha-sialidase [Chloroflexi bacterium]|nr:exo-alpha-sialidase [Chloroflexota bacterium]